VVGQPHHHHHHQSHYSVGPSGGVNGTRQQGFGAEEPLLPRGMLDMPCLESSANTLSVEGALSPKGNGSHGLLIASFTTLSTTSSACMHACMHGTTHCIRNISLYVHNSKHQTSEQQPCH